MRGEYMPKCPSMSEPPDLVVREAYAFLANLRTRQACLPENVRDLRARVHEQVRDARELFESNA